MAAALQVGLVKEEPLVSAVLLDVNLCGDDVIDIGAGIAALAQVSDLTEGIPRENMRDGSPAPLRGVVEPAKALGATLPKSIAIGVPRSALRDGSGRACRHRIISPGAPARSSPTIRSQRLRQ